jgi:hypothetical protein
MRSARLLVLATAIAAIAVFVATAAATTVFSGQPCTWLTAAQAKAVLGVNAPCQSELADHPSSQGPTWAAEWHTPSGGLTIAVSKPPASLYAEDLVAEKLRAAEQKPPIKSIGVGTWAGIFKVTADDYRLDMLVNGYYVEMAVVGIYPKSSAPLITLAREVASHM